jgi:hypothetical protein
MPPISPKGFVVAKALANVVLIVLAFAVVIPNCIVPAHGATPQHFAWSGLISSFMASAIATYCIWFWK